MGKKVEPSTKVGINAVNIGSAKPQIQKCSADKGATSAKLVKHKTKNKLGLSAIQDAEITGYLNNKKEMVLKKMLWELTNKKHLKEKQLKQAILKTMKSNPVKNAAKTDIKVEDKKKKSSNINYDILEKLMDDSLSEENSKRVTGTATSSDGSSYGGNELRNRKSSSETYGFGETDNLDYEKEYGEEVDASEDHYGGYMDFDNEEEKYCYDD